MCPLKLIRSMKLQQETEKILINSDLGLLFNLTTTKKLKAPGCPNILLYVTTLKGVYVSLEAEASGLNHIQNQNEPKCAGKRRPVT